VLAYERHLLYVKGNLLCGRFLVDWRGAELLNTARNSNASFERAVREDL
jgi:hypothetical protein